MAILTQSGRTAIAQAIASQSLHLAVGTGDPAWDDLLEQEPGAATGLVAEVGRRLLHQWSYCTPDDNGDIVVSSGRFQSSETPTNHLYLKFQLDYADAADAVIRELGVFMGSVTDPELPIGQRFFTPAQVVSPGILLQLERPRRIEEGVTKSAPIYRAANIRNTEELVITF